MSAAGTANAVATIEPKLPGVLGDVQRMETQFALALPEHVSAERFVRVVITAIRTSPQLTKADRESVLSAAMKCAQDGLLPDGREAALVVYGTTAQYLPMIAGILTKVRRSGDLKTIAAHVVYEKDAFNYTLGDEERIEHQPFLDGPRGKPIAVYAVAKTKDDGVYREVMSVAEVEQVRAVSRAKNNGPWVQWWGEMARKTVLRRLSKRLPMSTDLQQVFSRDDDHYDLREARGAAKLRRLHADFDDPPEAEDVIEGQFEEAGSVTPPADDFPGDRSAPDASGDEGGFGEPQDDDPTTWAAEQTRLIDLAETVAQLDAITSAADAPANFEKLQAHSPSVAKELNAQIKGKRKALVDRERAE